jgi:NhaA family Na+:H+ antiporter
MPFLPHAARDPGFFVDARPNASDSLSQFERWWKYPGQVALFFFGLVNAGVPIGALEPGTLGLPIAVIVGKPLGVLIGVGLASLGGLHLPHPGFDVKARRGCLAASLGMSRCSS